MLCDGGIQAEESSLEGSEVGKFGLELFYNFRDKNIITA